MKPSRRLLLVAAGLLGATSVMPLSACSTDPDLVRADIAREPAGDPDPEVARAICDFTATMLGWGEGNLVCSPLSLYIALGMLRQGARGDTAAELDDVLGVSVDRLDAGLNTILQLLAQRSGRRRRSDGEKAKVTLSLAQQVWCQPGYPFEQPFLEALARWFGAGVAETDFQRPAAAAKEINRWVAKQTDDAIEELVDADFLAQALLVLTNAVHLKAPWDEDFTEREAQSFDGGDEVAMMGRTMTAPAWTDDDLSAVLVPYAGDELAMLVVLPTEGVELQLGAGRLHEILDGAGPGTVELTLPPFEFESTLDLEQDLQRAGLKAMFSDAADLSAITTAEPLQVKRVRQVARIAVDEKGTEASAATAVAVGPTGAPAPAEPVVMVCDRPFLFAIVDLQTRVPVFGGWVRQP